MVDQDAEFGSVYFESLLTRCLVTKLDRPPQQPRFGSVVECLFGTTTTEMLHQLRGNTQASKTPRHMTQEIDPKRIAVNGPRLSQFLQKLQGDEALLLQRKLDLEEQAQREAILLKKPEASKIDFRFRQWGRICDDVPEAGRSHAQQNTD